MEEPLGKKTRQGRDERPIQGISAKQVKQIKRARLFPFFSPVIPARSGEMRIKTLKR